MPTKESSMSAEEKRWRAKDDAYTLSTAQQIQADKARFKAARKELKAMLAEEQKKVKAMQDLISSDDSV
jgi:hypothetical protein